MPDLYHSLLGHDLGHLHIIADFWGLALISTDSDAAAKELAAALLDPERVRETLDVLPTEARAALAALAAAHGRVPWAIFTRKFGETREMGAGRRDREKPYQNPASPAEVLFYRALMGRAFFDAPGGPQEFAYLPDELLSLIQQEGPGTRRKTQNAKTKDARDHGDATVRSAPLGRQATPAERAHFIPANDHILDEATTLLAALRLGRRDSPDPALSALLSAAGLIKKGVPQAGPVRAFLEASRADALRTLVEAWKVSEAFNELRQVPGLVCEGEWTNPVLATRNSILGFLGTVPRGKWWGIQAFVGDIKQKDPDFQRPAGDYDSWFVKRAADGVYLRGFESWDEVDGALIRYSLTGVLHRLGRLDLANPAEGREPTAFRIVESRASTPENGKWKVASNAGIAVPASVPRAARYQLARFCEWEGQGPDEYRYRITPASLENAAKQDLKAEQLIALLVKHAGAGIPPVLVKALKRWEVHGTEARAETQVVLRVSQPGVVEELRKSKAARFLGEPLGPTAIVIKAGARSKVMAALAEMGLLAEDASRNDEQT